MDSIVRLNCGHEIRFAGVSCPKVNEQILCTYCPRGDDVRAVTRSPAGYVAYRAVCTSCKYGVRSWALHIIIGQIKKHVNKYGHTMKLLDDHDHSMVLRTVSPKNVLGAEQLSLDNLEIMV